GVCWIIIRPKKMIGFSEIGFEGFHIYFGKVNFLCLLSGNWVSLKFVRFALKFGSSTPLRSVTALKLLHFITQFGSSASLRFATSLMYCDAFEQPLVALRGEGIQFFHDFQNIIFRFCSDKGRFPKIING